MVLEGNRYTLFLRTNSARNRLEAPINHVALFASALWYQRKKTGVLVVEDDGGLRKVVYHQLQRLGVMCDTASSGEEAIGFASRKRYRLILMDLHLPGMDGCETAKRILDLYGDRDVRIIGVSAYGEERKRCMEVGMTAYYEKPVMLSQLQEIIAPYLPAGGAT